MSKKLNSHDGQAVNILLETASQSSSGHASARFVQPDPSLNQHVISAKRVLALLDLMPVEEPPADLVQRTLRRIQQSLPSGRSASTGLGEALGPMA